MRDHARTRPLLSPKIRLIRPLQAPVRSSGETRQVTAYPDATGWVPGLGLTLSLVASLLLGGCARNVQTETVLAPGVGDVELRFAEREVEDDRRLNVSIAAFAVAAEPVREDATSASARHRVEANYIPFALREVMASTGLWGAVRVLPQPDPAAELQISGTILASRGAELVLHVKAWDGTGRLWLDREYIDYATEEDYAATQREPFGDIYRQIANDLHVVRKTLSNRDLRRIADTALMRYAAELVPDAYRDYVSTTPDGRAIIQRLPAASDPVLRRIENIRDSEYLFIETVDDHYGALFRSLRPKYTLWRRYDFEQSEALRQYLERTRERPPPSTGTLRGMQRAYDSYREAKYWQETLNELAASFALAAEPTAIQTEGQLLELTGTLEEQYQEWRRLMRAIFLEEQREILPR